MNITKIGVTSVFSRYKAQENNNKNNSGINKNFQSIPFDVVTFSASNKKSNNDKKLENIMMYADASCKALFSRLFSISKETEYNTVTPMHVIYDGINETYKYMNDLDNGIKDYKSDKAPEMAELIGDNVTYSVFSDKEIRKKVKPVIENYVKISREVLEKIKLESFDLSKEPKLSNELIDYIWSYRTKENETVNPSTILLETANEDSD